MQSYLGDYPDSRKNPEEKFIRAVNSFLKQTNKNTELVIASDGCETTESIYKEKWIGENRIKFIKIENKQRMYQKEESMTFYRGLPRQTAKEIASGDIITYMDSDDFILPDYLELLNRYWEENPELDWIVNMSWYDNIKIIESPTIGYYQIFEAQKIEDSKKIEGLDSLWIKARVKNEFIVMSPALLSHKKSCSTKWEDTYSERQSEDQLFNRKLRQEYKKGTLIDLTGYVRCHLKKKWDF